MNQHFRSYFVALSAAAAFLFSAPLSRARKPIPSSNWAKTSSPPSSP